jgi:hypothetical protein
MSVPLDTDGQLAVISEKLDNVLAAQAEQKAQLHVLANWQVQHELMHARGSGGPPAISTPASSGGVPDIVWKIIWSLAGAIAALVAAQTAK